MEPPTVFQSAAPVHQQPPQFQQPPFNAQQPPAFPNHSHHHRSGSLKLLTSTPNLLTRCSSNEAKVQPGQRLPQPGHLLPPPCSTAHPLPLAFCPQSLLDKVE